MHLPIQVIVLTHSTTLGSTIRTIVATEPPLIRVCAALTVDHAHTISQGRVPDVVLLDGQLPPPSVGATMAALQSCGWQTRCLVLLPGAEASCLSNHMGSGASGCDQPDRTGGDLTADHSQHCPPNLAAPPGYAGFQQGRDDHAHRARLETTTSDRP